MADNFYNVENALKMNLTAWNSYKSNLLRLLLNYNSPSYKPHCVRKQLEMYCGNLEKWLRFKYCLFVVTYSFPRCAFIIWSLQGIKQRTVHNTITTICARIFKAWLDLCALLFIQHQLLQFLHYRNFRHIDHKLFRLISFNSLFIHSF